MEAVAHHSASKEKQDDDQEENKEKGHNLGPELAWPLSGHLIRITIRHTKPLGSWFVNVMPGGQDHSVRQMLVMAVCGIEFQSALQGGWPWGRFERWIPCHVGEPSSRRLAR